LAQTLVPGALPPGARARGDEKGRIAREPHLTGWRAADPAPVGIHVRRSDFVQQDNYQDMVQVDNSLLPLDWYIAALQAVRAAVGSDVRDWPTGPPKPITSKA
jgi:hypothetical protein